MSDTLIAAIRTGVPLAVGWLVAWLAARDIVVDDTTQAALVTGITSLAAAVYWALVQAISKAWPAAQWLLGVPRTPSYTDPEPAAPTPDTTTDGSSGVLMPDDPPQDQVPQDHGDHSTGPRVDEDPT